MAHCLNPEHVWWFYSLLILLKHRERLCVSLSRNIVFSFALQMFLSDSIGHDPDLSHRFSFIFSFFLFFLPVISLNERQKIKEGESSATFQSPIDSVSLILPLFPAAFHSRSRNRWQSSLFSFRIIERKRRTFFRLSVHESSSHCSGFLENETKANDEGEGKFVVAVAAVLSLLVAVRLSFSLCV